MCLVLIFTLKLKVSQNSLIPYTILIDQRFVLNMNIVPKLFITYTHTESG